MVYLLEPEIPPRRLCLSALSNYTLMRSAIVCAIMVRPASFGWQPSQVSGSPATVPPNVAFSPPLTLSSGVQISMKPSTLLSVAI